MTHPITAVEVIVAVIVAVPIGIVLYKFGKRRYHWWTVNKIVKRAIAQGLTHTHRVTVNSSFGISKL